MRPSKIKAGTKLLVKSTFGDHLLKAVFIKRIPAAGGRAAVNYLRFPDFAGMDGPDDDGTCQMSDYDLSRRGEYATTNTA